jgi:hypothetical protein
MKNAIVGFVSALLFRFGLKRSVPVVVPSVPEAPATVLSFIELVQLEEGRQIVSRY